MRRHPRTAMLASAILALALVAQSCTAYDVFTFAAAFTLQETFRKNVATQVGVEYYVAAHIAFVCGIANIFLEPWVDQSNRSARAKLPRFATLTMHVFPPGGGEQTYPYRMKIDKKEGVYSGAFDTPGSSRLRLRNTDECPAFELDPGTFVGFSLKPERGTFAKGSTMQVELAVQPIREIEECEETEIEASNSRTVRQVRWRSAKPSAASTLRVNASGDGILVHCVDTPDGQQATIEMILNGGGKEIVGITCVD